MTKFVTMVMAVEFTVVLSAAVMADNGWKIGNWEPPKVPMVKAVSFNADWGTTAEAPVSSVAPAGCRGMVQHAEPAQRAGCSGRGRFLGWPGWRIRANRQARAQARVGTGHS